MIKSSERSWPNTYEGAIEKAFKLQREFSIFI